MLGEFQTNFQQDVLSELEEGNKEVCDEVWKSLKPITIEYAPEDPHPHVSLQ